jgi:hypothetical protein
LTAFTPIYGVTCHRASLFGNLREKLKILEGNFFIDQIKEDRVNAGNFTLGEKKKTKYV